MLNTRFLDVDRAMQRRADAIYGNPQRHKFYSAYDQDDADDRRGPRGGKIRGRKTVCAYCGCKKDEHAEVTYLHRKAPSLQGGEDVKEQL